MARHGKPRKHMTLFTITSILLQELDEETRGSSPSSANKISSAAPASQPGKKKTTANKRVIDEQPPPLMPEPMRRKIQELMGGVQDKNNIKAGPTWLESKVLEESDVNPQSHRLFLPNKNKLSELLSEEEEQALAVEKGKGKGGGMRSGLVDADGEFWPLDFRMWASLRKYVLANEWKEFVTEHQLRAKDSVQIWCFRDSNWKFCFAMNIGHRPRQEDDKDASCSNGGTTEDESGRSKRRRSGNGKCTGKGGSSTPKKKKI